jgi:hypothetical protein
MVEKARTNALVNGLHNAEFHADDLARPGGKLPWLKSLKVRSHLMMFISLCILTGTQRRWYRSTRCWLILLARAPS